MWTWLIIMAENLTSIFELLFGTVNAMKKKDLASEIEKL